jgi:type IV secretion system protein VirB10
MDDDPPTSIETEKIKTRAKREFAQVRGWLLIDAAPVPIELSQRQNASLLTTPTAGQTASSAVGQQLGQLGTEITRKNLSIQPTLKIPVGHKFNVRVNRDILFEAPHTPVEL